MDADQCSGRRVVYRDGSTDLIASWASRSAGRLFVLLEQLAALYKEREQRCFSLCTNPERSIIATYGDMRCIAAGR